MKNRNDPTLEIYALIMQIWHQGCILKLDLRVSREGFAIINKYCFVMIKVVKYSLYPSTYINSP
jgi:hypothetical protein